MRAIWLQTKDVIDLRITATGRPSGETIVRSAVAVHLNPSSGQLLGFLLADNKMLRLGRWLRANWQEIPFTEGDPVPSGTVVYDEGAQFAYFSIWPNLSGEEPKRVERRRGEAHIDENGDLQRIRLPVTVRREDGLAVAAGYLPTR